jgi:phospholipid transport system transporter-binding protein
MTDAQVFKPSSRLTFDTVQLNVKPLMELLHDNSTKIIRLDLQGIIECDSAGLALLIEIKRLCHQYNKSLLIEEMPNSIALMAEFCGVDAVLA